jgi:hypothetical protein
VRRPWLAHFSAARGSANVRTVISATALLTLPLAVAAAGFAHGLASRAVKAVLGAASPVPQGELQAYGYERDPWRSAEPALWPVVGLALLAGLPLWAAFVWRSGAWFGVALVLGLLALALDVLRWQRVAAGASALWVQRGFWSERERIDLERVRDVAVDETDTRGFTFRRGTANRLCRLTVRMKDRSELQLPATDAHSGLEAVEAVANQVRQRMRHLEHREELKASQAQADKAVAAVQADGERPSAADAELRAALKKLRRGALAPDVPKAVQLPEQSS